MASDGGKGSKPRPFTDRQKFEQQFDLIFGKNKKSDDWDEKRVDIIGSNGNEGLHYEKLKKDN